MRIALNLKQLSVDQIKIELRSGDQRSNDYRSVNAGGLVPSLDLEPGVLRQSMAIIG